MYSYKVMIILEVYHVSGLDKARFVRGWDGSIYFEIPASFGDPPQFGVFPPPPPGVHRWDIKEALGEAATIVIQSQGGYNITLTPHSRVEVSGPVKAELLRCNRVP